MNDQKLNPHEFIQRLRKGEKLDCPECGKSKIQSVGDPKTTHGFYCTKCKFRIIID